MKQLFQKPLFVALIFCVGIFSVCLFVPIPMYDGVFSYHRKLVQFEQENKIALSYFIQIGIEKTRVGGLLPEKITFKPVGYLLFALVHFGLPILIGLRVYFSNQKKNND